MHYAPLQLEYDAQVNETRLAFSEHDFNIIILKFNFYISSLHWHTHYIVMHPRLFYLYFFIFATSNRVTSQQLYAILKKKKI